MSDNPSPGPTPPAETGTPNTAANISGGVNLDAQRDVHIGGDVVARDKIVQNIGNFFGFDTEQQRALRNRRNMLELVKNNWVEGVLEKTLYHEVMLDLGLEQRPDEVQHPWDMMLQMPEHDNRVLPPGTKIMQVFDETNHALLILGEPGSGKTTMLLELARDTIARAEQDPTRPIPVVFNLSSWSANPKQSIAEWLVQELRDKYNVSKKIAQPWIENNDLLLLLDGLDEVKAECREMCVKAINDFRNEHGQAQLVVCSRIADYEALSAQLKLNGAIFIRALTVQQINTYLAQGGDEIAKVRKALLDDADLQEVAQSPLMLNIMVLAYEGLSVEVIGDGSLRAIADRRSHLLDAYVEKMFKRVARASNRLYPKEQSVGWLAWLAQRMTEHAHSIFSLDQMLPSWLPEHQRRTHRIVGGLIGGLVCLPISWLMGGMVFGLVAGLIWGLLVGLIVGLDEKSRFISLKWSWQAAWKWLVLELMVWLGLGLALGAVLMLLIGNVSGLVIGLYIGLIGGMYSGLLAGVLRGLQRTEIKSWATPNQVIQQSAQNAMIVGLLYGFATGLVSTLSSILLNTEVNGFNTGLFLGMAMMFAYGGIALISHFTLRFMLYRNGDIPWNYVRFLDYAADRIFLRKVGGGYIFIHRMLMEYFAALEAEASDRK